MIIRSSFAVCLSLMLSSLEPVSAATIVFQQGVSPSGSYSGGAATYIRRGTSAAVNNNGATTNILIGAIPAAANPLIRGLFSFDLSSIPVGSTINSVSFGLTAYQADASSVNGTFTLNLQQLSTNFSESQATWNNAATSVPWTTSGGDFSGTVLSSISLNPVTLTPNISNSFATSASFVAAVQSAVDGSQSFQFLVKMANEAPASRVAFFFVDDENSFGIGTTGARPILTIDYTAVPEPTTGVLLLGGLVALGCRRRGGSRMNRKV